MRIDVYLHDAMAESGVDTKLDRVLTMLGALKAQNERILMNEIEMKAALDKIDVATTKVGNNLVAVNEVVTEIGTDVDAMVLALQAAGVPPELIAQAEALSAKAEAVGAATDALVPVLRAIASKGGVDVVPIPVPPPIEIPPPPPEG